MTNQLNFKLPAIDREKTRNAVEEALDKYRIYLLTEAEERHPKITQEFTLVPPSNTNSFHSSTEDAAITNVDRERERATYMRKILKAVNRLRKIERGIIVMRYMSEDGLYDYEVYNELGMSERNYYRIKARAFYNLAFMLRIEIYEEKKGGNAS